MVPPRIELALLVCAPLLLACSTPAQEPLPPEFTLVVETGNLDVVGAAVVLGAQPGGVHEG